MTYRRCGAIALLSDGLTATSVQGVFYDGARLCQNSCDFSMKNREGIAETLDNDPKEQQLKPLS